MKEAEYLWVDARGQVKELLEGMECSVPYTVRASFPKGRPEGNVVTWKEYANVSTPIPVVDEIVFQVDLWTADQESIFALSQGVNRALVGAGFARRFAGPAAWRDEGMGYYHRVLRFGRKVDKRFMRLID